MTPPELSIVMPVYNEGDSVDAVVSEWVAALDALGMTYEFIVLDDGSRDRTGEILDAMAARTKALRVLRHGNRGHGQTIVRGYAEAQGEWVFQIDSDGEIAPDGFRDLWTRRADYDWLAGRREHRSASIVRQMVTGVSRLSVYALFGTGIYDVNVPYRLMRNARLREMTPFLPAGAFAPNVILSGLAIRFGLRTYETPVAHIGRRHGTSTLGRLNILKPAAMSLWQTAVAAWRSRHGRAGRAR